MNKSYEKQKNPYRVAIDVRSYYPWELELLHDKLAKMFDDLQCDRPPACKTAKIVAQHKCTVCEYRHLCKHIGDMCDRIEYIIDEIRKNKKYPLYPIDKPPIL